MKRFEITMYHNGRANKVFFPTLEAASKVANDIFTRQGIVVGVEAVNAPQKWYVGVKGTSRVVADAERLAKLQDELKKKYGKEKSEPATLPRRL